MKAGMMMARFHTCVSYASGNLVRTSLALLGHRVTLLLAWMDGVAETAAAPQTGSCLLSPSTLHYSDSDSDSDSEYDA